MREGRERETEREREREKEREKERKRDRERERERGKSEVSCEVGLKSASVTKRESRMSLCLYFKQFLPDPRG